MWVYKYLGVIFDLTNNDDRETKRMILQTRNTVECLNGILWNKDNDRLKGKEKYKFYVVLVKSMEQKCGMTKKKKKLVALKVQTRSEDP